MDKAQADARGITPLQPLLTEIDKLRNKADLGKLISHLHAINISVPFAMGSNADLHTPTDVIAWVAASGLGLPDRDYYLKPEARFVDAREKTAQHHGRCPGTDRLRYVT